MAPTRLSSTILRRATLGSRAREIVPPRVKHDSQITSTVQVSSELFAGRTGLLGLGELDDTFALGSSTLEEDLGEDDDADGFE